MLYLPAEKNIEFLLIDLDPQSSLTYSFFYRPTSTAELVEGHKTIKQWFDEFSAGQGDTELVDLVLTPPEVLERIPSEGALDIIASHLGLINVDLDLAGQLIGRQPTARFLGVHSRLREGLRNGSLDGYDVVLIDCPPNFNIVTKTAIVASDHLLIPSRADDLSTLGINYLLDSVKGLVHEYNDCVAATSRSSFARQRIDPQVLGVVFTMVGVRGQAAQKKVNQEFMSKVRRELEIETFDNFLRFSQSPYAVATKSGVPLAIARDTPRVILNELNGLADEFVSHLGLRGDV